MADTIPKLNLTPALTIPLALSHVGYQLLAQVFVQHGGKVTSLKDHPLLEKLNAWKGLLLAVLGVALVFHGAQFKNILLCTQVVMAFLYDRVKSSVMAIYTDIQTAREKLQADEPVKESSDEQKSKHAKKREEKKNGSSADTQKEDAEVAKKALNVLSSEKLSAASVEVLASLMACVLVIHGGLAQSVAISHALVELARDKLMAVVEFPGHEDIQAWTSLFVTLALYALFLPLAVVAAPLALALNAAACGARLATEHGVRYLAAAGKISDAEVFLASKKGFLALAGLTGFGTFWQIWTWAAGGGMGLIFQMLYLPAVILEAVLGLL